jgi:hypothetical protein
MNVQRTLANNTTLPKRMSHDLYMFLAISSMFMTVAFTPYHPLPPTEVPPVLQLFFTFIVHCYRLLHSAVRFLAKRPALFLCQSTRPSAVCICIYSFTPLSYHFPAIPASHYYLILSHLHGPLAIPSNK